MSNISQFVVSVGRCWWLMLYMLTNMSGIGYFVVSTWQALVVDAKFADKHV
jgi:hypothetical protein